MGHSTRRKGARDSDASHADERDASSLHAVLAPGEAVANDTTTREAGDASAAEIASGVFAKRGTHAGREVVERVLRSADEARHRGDSFRRWRRLGAPPEWQSLSIPQRRAVEVLFWGLRIDHDDAW
ncbi:MAG: hypothetical protein H6722_16315 [Sandaracinus sp.]|nr:hypothetical protein [Sandaracinus sp.]MCB9614005.1 hypothetical protein [Sandaracinus sp.]MCB9624330.1 hypothetical protein [Sandaracinus sp.]